jgi:hypothetical protein
MAGRWLAGDSRSGTLQEPQIDRREYQDNSDVYYQPLPEVVPKEQDVHADHDDGYQCEHVQHDGCLSSDRFVLLCATEWSKSGVGSRLLVRSFRPAPERTRRSDSPAKLRSTDNSRGRLSWSRSFYYVGSQRRNVINILPGFSVGH